MDERVLAVPAERLRLAGEFSGFTDRVEAILPFLLDPAWMRWVPRSEAEDDPSLKQLIPYAVLRHGGKVWHYARTGGGEARLRSRRSVGIGGHICSDDGEAGPAAYRAGLLRELAEEVEIAPGSAERCIGLINDDRTPVGRVHVGIVHVIDLATAEVRSREPGMAAGGFARVEELRREREMFETWSQFLLDGPWLEG